MESLATGLIIFILIFAIIIIILSVLELIGMWKIFKKAGKKGWEAIIPYYNIWVLNEISGCVWWFFLLAIASSLISFDLSLNLSETSKVTYNPLEFIGSITNLFAMYMINYNISKKFGKSHGYAIGLTLLPYIFYPILGFGKNNFDNNIKVSPYGAIKEGEI